jgi:ABC-type phosphate transport system substrate-binding protein
LKPQATLLTTLLALLPGSMTCAQAANADSAIAVVVAPGQERKLDVDELALIYRRKKLFWSEGVRVTPINLEANDPLRQLFSQRVLRISPEAMQRYWNDMYFNGVSPPHVLASAEAVLRFVAQTPGAVGYVAYCDADPRVHVALVLTPAGPVSEKVATGGLSCPKKPASPTGE